MNIVEPIIEDYLVGLAPFRDSILTEMERRAEKESFPIVGPLVGAVLAQFTMAIGARRVFECGSGFGYSAYWFVRGMGDQGTVILTDDEEENARDAAQTFKNAGLEGRVQIEVGDALDIIDRQAGSFDIIFIDCEKARYPLAFKKALPRLRRGGLLIADNVLWNGSVVQVSEDSRTRGIQAFNQFCAKAEGFFTTILPIRDGISISLRL